MVIIDLPKLHGIWRQQDNYKQIKTDNDEYDNGRPSGGILYTLSVISINAVEPNPRQQACLPPNSYIEIGFGNGRHRLDYFFRRGALILPVHATTEKSRVIIERHLAASAEAIARDLISYST